MPITRRRSRNWRTLRPLILFLLSTLFILSFTTACKPKVVTVPVAIGGERIVGKVIDGVLAWEPGEGPGGQYLVVTKGFWLTALRLEGEIRQLKLRIQQLEEKK